MSNHIPSAQEVEETGSGRSYRFSKGRIVTGRDEDKSLQVHENIVGNIVRVGIHEGKTNDNYKKPYKQVEADIETADGIVYVKAGLLDNETFELRPSRAALDFGWGLLQFAAGESVMIKTALGEPWTDEMGRAREASTYVNWSRLTFDEATGKWPATRTFRPKADKTAPKKSTLEQWNEIEAQLRALPHFAPRPATRKDEDEGPTHFSEFIKELAGYGWITPEDAPLEWLQIMAAYFEHPVRASLKDYTDDDWGGIRQGFAHQMKTAPKGMPQSLLDAKARIDAAKQSAAATPATSPASAASGRKNPFA